MSARSLAKEITEVQGIREVYEESKRFGFHMSMAVNKAYQNSSVQEKMYRSQLVTVEKASQAQVAVEFGCHAGCSACCHLRVSSSPVELVAILEYIERKFTAKQKRDFYDRIQTYDNPKLLDAKEWVFTGTKCVFLKNGKCQIYKVRPFNCVAQHSLDASKCTEAYEKREIAKFPLTAEYLIFMQGLGLGISEYFQIIHHVKDYELELHNSLAYLTREKDAVDKMLAGDESIKTYEVSITDIDKHK